MKKLLFSVLSVLFIHISAAQHATLSGIAASNGSHEGIPFANAALFSLSDTLFVRGASADYNGYFAISGITPGSYLLRISATGFQPYERTIEVSKRMNLDSIFLTEGTTLSEVRIMAAKPIFTMDGEKNIYHTSDDPSIQSGTVVDALQNAPGIEVDAEGNVRLRGKKEVTIWLNNRECRMNPDALKQYLKTLPASNVKKIEVITNPSARYGGGNPVVNIVTREKSMENKFVSTGINCTNKPNLSPWLSYIFNDNHWEIDLYASAAYDHNISRTNGQDTIKLNGIPSQTDRYRRSSVEQAANALLSLDLGYHPDSLSSFYLWLSAMGNLNSLSASESHNRHELIFNPNDYSYRQQTDKPWGKPSAELMDGFWYERMFDDSTGHTFFLGYYGSVGWRDSIAFLSRQYDILPQQDFSLSQQHSGSDWFHAFEAAYMLPFGVRDSVSQAFNNELEAGLEAFYTLQNTTVRTDSIFGSLSAPCLWLSHQAHSKSANANLYGSYLHRWGSLAAKIGLRGSLQSGSIAYPDAPAHNFSHTNWTLTPSLHLTYAPSPKSAAALSYTRRMSAPNTQDYSSRILYRLDDYSVGNPLLLQGSAHAFEGKYDYYADGLGSVGVNLFYTLHTNQQGTLTNVILEDRVFHRATAFSQPVNIGNAWNGGADIHLLYRPNAFVNIRLNGSLFYDYLDLQYGSDHNLYQNGLWCFSLRANAWVKLWQSVQFFGNFYFNSPTQSLFSTTLSRKGIDLGVNADLWHHRLSINLCVNDLFDWNSWSTTSANPNLPSLSDTKFVSRYASLGITLRFGQMDLANNSPQKGRHHGSPAPDDEPALDGE